MTILSNEKPKGNRMQNWKENQIEKIEQKITENQEKTEWNMNVNQMEKRI